MTMGNVDGSSPAPLCFLCARYRDSYRCEAFPDGIPFDIIASEKDHRRPIKGDHGLHFLPITDVADQYAEDLFVVRDRETRPRIRRRRRVTA